MKKIVAGLLLLSAITSKAQSFSRYLVQFTNKANTPYALANPSAYLSQRAIDRRTRYGIAVDSTDLPVPPRFVDSLRLAGAVTILNVSKWLNQVSIQTTDSAALAKINSFSFVAKATPIAARINMANGKNGQQAYGRKKASVLHKKKFQPAADYFNYGSSYQQIHLHNGEFLHNIGLRGQGMTMGIFDGGFYHYTTLKAFDSVMANGQVLGVYDFVAKDNSVVEDDDHGMQCFSVIAANLPGQFVGAAPKANFYLYRSEDVVTEFPIEEHNWVCAAERLDSAGGDVVSSSLGYSDGMTVASFDHTYAQLDGNTTIAARGADLAAKKGILVVNAAGNQGNETFRYISTPADGDSVMAVGAVDKNGNVASFSSYGPSADGQVKPDVASVGVSATVQTPANTIGTNNGTSFATPNMAGLATCLWQGFREFNNIKILRALQQAGSKASAPDNRVGFGIPDVKKAVMNLLNDFSTAAITASTPCRHTLSWTSKDVSSMRYEVERRGAGQTSFTKIGSQQGTGLVFDTHSYQFVDSALNIAPGQISYRIRQVIDTAAATFMADYIDSVSLNYTMACNVTAINGIAPQDAALQLTPNPATSKITVRLTTAYPVAQLYLRIVSSKGQTVLQQKQSKASGTAEFLLPVQALAKGTYILVVYNGSTQLASTKFMKL